LKLSVIILNYNVRHFLELCLTSVEAALKDISAEIIVVDNASQDDSCSTVRAKFPKVILIENETNLGFSKGNNIGVEQAKGQYVCILNPDTVVAENAFSKLLEFAEAQERLGIIGCKLIDGQGNFLPESKRYIPSPWVSTKKMLGLTDSYYVPEINEDDIGNVEILVGAFMLLKKQVYLEVGGFDEDYFMYGEDVDLSYKILKKGYKNIYNGNVAIIHFKGESTLKDKVYVKRFYGAMQIFYQKHFRSNWLFNIMVWNWLKVASLFNRPSGQHNKKVNHYVFISDEKYNSIENKLNETLVYEPDLNNYSGEVEYILDTGYLSFSRIIQILNKKPISCKATFKIFLKNSNFILGSDDSKRRGTVIEF